VGDLLAVLPRLGVFQGGGFESKILQIAEFVPEQWQQLKAALLRTGLVQVKAIEKIKTPFLRFHPTLAPVLWMRLTAEEKGDLRLRYQQHYYDFVSSLYNLDQKNPAKSRLIIRPELSNLLWAVKGALADQSENVVDFVYFVNLFLHVFDLKRDRAFLTERLNQIASTVGSINWYLVRSNEGERLYHDGQYAAAAVLFTEILQGLDTASSTELSFNRIKTLALLGCCLQDQGQLSEADRCLREALDLSEQLEQSDGVKKQRVSLQSDLGNVLKHLGKYSEAQQMYENSIAIAKAIDDQRGIAIAEDGLGTLAVLQGDLFTAMQKYQSVLKIFSQLQEPSAMADSLHKLGMMYEKFQQWGEADRAYRESARISEKQGDTNGTFNSYGQLANLSVKMNRLTDAEGWYRKILKISRVVGDRVSESKALVSLAYLLSDQPNHLSEAQQLATAALEIDRTVDPAAAAIWGTYRLLAKIATSQGKTDKAREYRQLARTTKAAFAGTQFELQQHAPLIELVVAAMGDAAAREQLEPMLVQGVEVGRGQVVVAIRRVLAGEREVEALWDDLDADDSMIIAAILRGV
jgi:tetratricopeptide (TPR) repeat protein